MLCQMVMPNILELPSLHESPYTYRLWECSYYSGLMGGSKCELTGNPPKKTRDRNDMGRKLMSDLKNEPEAACVENENLRCENTY